MILCIDAGNTLIKCGLYSSAGKIENKFSFDSKRECSSNEYEIILKNFVGSETIEGAIISSVVPRVINVLMDAIYDLYGIKALLITKALKTGIQIKIDYPNELGSDLLCGAVGAKYKFKDSILVADLGTATKLYVIDKDGSYIGGVITTGIEVSMKALNNSTSLLLEVPLRTPKKIVCKNTKECIQSGIMYGQAFMIKEFLRRIEQELGYKLTPVLTGGFSNELKNELNNFYYEPYLVLDGLYEIYKNNERGN